MLFTPDRPEEPEENQQESKTIWEVLFGTETEKPEHFSPPPTQSEEYQIMLDTLLYGESNLKDYAQWLDVVEQLQISGYVQNCLVSGQYEQLHALLTHLICENTVWRRIVNYGLDSGELYYGNDILFVNEEELKD